MGANGVGQLGLGDKTTRLTPQKIMLDKIISVYTNNHASRTFILTRNGDIYVCGQYQYIDYLSPQKLLLSNIISISYGYNHYVSITKHNEIYVWGNNIYGQLGLGDTIGQDTPVILRIE